MTDALYNQKSSKRNIINLTTLHQKRNKNSGGLYHLSLFKIKKGNRNLKSTKLIEQMRCKKLEIILRKESVVIGVQTEESKNNMLSDHNQNWNKT